VLKWRVFQCVLVTCTDLQKMYVPVFLGLSCADHLVLPFLKFTHTYCSQTSISFLWPGRKSVVGRAVVSAPCPGTAESHTNGGGSLVKRGTAGQQLPLCISKAVPAILTTATERRRTQAKMMSAATAAASGELLWRGDGEAFPVAPAPWNPSSANTLLCAQIAAHNSYVSALDSQEVADAIDALAAQHMADYEAGLDVGIGVGGVVGAGAGAGA